MTSSRGRGELEAERGVGGEIGVWGELGVGVGNGRRR